MIHLYLCKCRLANTHTQCFHFGMFAFSVQVWHVALNLTFFSPSFFFVISAFLWCQAALRARWTVCVICVTVSMAPWQKRTCSADAVRGGLGYCEHCSASSTSTLPSSTCTSPSSALLWVVCVCVCVSVCLPLSLTRAIVWSFLHSSLQLCVSGNNLLNICKLIFKISRSESNDILFQNNSIIGEQYSRSGSSSVVSTNSYVPKYSSLGLFFLRFPISQPMCTIWRLTVDVKLSSVSRLIAGCAEQWGCVCIWRSSAVQCRFSEISLWKQCNPQTPAGQELSLCGSETHPETLHSRRHLPHYSRTHPCTGVS